MCNKERQLFVTTKNADDDVDGNESEKLATRARNKQPISEANCSPFVKADTLLSHSAPLTALLVKSSLLMFSLRHNLTKMVAFLPFMTSHLGPIQSPGHRLEQLCCLLTCITWQLGAI